VFGNKQSLSGALLSNEPLPGDIVWLSGNDLLYGADRKMALRFPFRVITC
jgi:hypothetical protein